MSVEIRPGAPRFSVEGSRLPGTRRGRAPARSGFARPKKVDTGSPKRRGRILERGEAL
jgi:hypothetical protein